MKIFFNKHIVLQMLLSVFVFEKVLVHSDNLSYWKVHAPIGLWTYIVQPTTYSACIAGVSNVRPAKKNCAAREDVQI